MLISKKQQSGVSIIESIIALLIISIGLLGIASLQGNAMKQNSSAFWRSQAVINAHNMADRIRANESAVNSYIGIDTEGEYNQSCLAKECTTEDMKNADATDWKRMVENLPNGRGIIRAPVANQLDIVVLWDDEATGATGTNCGNDPEVDLTCYTITMSTQ